MVSERVQRRIDSLLDDAESAIQSRDWATVVGRCEAVLVLDPANQDAQTYQTAAKSAGRSLSGETEPQSKSTPIVAPAHPESFVAGRYKVERLLNDGAKKRVFLARDTSLERRVAFAQLRTEGLDSKGRQRLIREARAMARLGNHPRLVGIYDIGEEGGTPFIVEEYMEGGDLASQLRDTEGGLALARVLFFGLSVCEALVFIHEKQLLHRDLKPSNVFLAGDGSAKVGDFGLTVSLDRSRLTTESSLIGTPSYMPPEQALGGPVTAQSDVYSLGAMLYELVTGRPPFVGDDPTTIISQHVNTRPVAPSWYSEHCPSDLEAVILQCLEKIPADRPHSAADVRDVLAKVDPAGRSSSQSGSSANPLDRLAQGVFVGRAKELDRLRDAFDKAFAGHGNLVLLLGDSGIGKTRTSKEIETHARMRGAQVLVGKTHESAGMPAYWPWVEVGRAWSEQNTGDLTLLQPTLGTAGPELTRIFPELREMAPNIAEPEPIIDPESAQFRLLDAYTTFVRAMAEHRPLLIVLDDLHWADRPTLMLLQHLARTLARMRVLIIGIYRDTEVVRASALSETLANLNREPGFERIVLRGLERQEVGAYIRATANVNVSPTLIQRIHEATEGIPFFLSEVVNLMAEEGTLSAEPTQEVALPDGVKEALGRRLNRLSPEANELLQVASVAGREFRHDTLLALGEQSEDRLFALLEEGLDARVIEEAGQAGRYRFTHGLMQETLLDELSTTRKVRLHGRIGDALESRWGDRAEERATRLAEHFVDAAPISDRYAERAFKYARLAAEQAETQSAWSEAARHYEACLALLSEAEYGLDGNEAELCLAAGRCHRDANAPRDAWRRLMRAIDFFRASNDATGVARATIEAERVFGPDRERLADLVRRALDALGDAEPELEARLLARLAAHVRDTPEGDKAVARAALLADQRGLIDVKGELAFAEGYRQWNLGAYDLAAERFAEAVRAAETTGQGESRAAALTWHAIATILTGKTADAEESIRHSINFARDHHHPFFEESSASHLAGLLYALCRFDEADVIVEQYGNAANFSFALHRSEQALLRGDASAARQLLPGPEIVAGHPESEGMIYAAIARVLMLNGETEPAKEAFERMREAAARADTPEINGVKVMPQPLGYLDATIFDVADVSYQQACFRFYQTLAMLPPVDIGGHSRTVIFGHLAIAQGELKIAADTFAQTLAWADKNGADIIAGRCHLGLAELARRRSEIAEAGRHMDTAARLFQKHGAKLYLDEAITKKLQLQGLSDADVGSSILAASSLVEAEKPSLLHQAAADGSGTLVFSAADQILSARESEVLALVASGNSNAEIAKSLTISERTVERHVQNIYAKLNVHNRVGATKWAIERGLA